MILERIVAHKKREIEQDKNSIPLDILRDRCEAKAGEPTRPFAAALRRKGEVALIAEIKKASPSKGLIRRDFDPRQIARIYSDNGASAISVLTDREFFQGCPEYLEIAGSEADIPILRKDFIIDPYQVYEARLMGADAILLIMAILTDREARDLQGIAAGLGMACLVEVHTADELARALSAGAQVIGINNRDLNTFKTELATTFRLREKITDPGITVVSESGINTREDVIKLGEYGIHAMLVGEALMREPDIKGRLLELLGK